MAGATGNPIELGVQNRKVRVDITLLDDEGNRVDATELELEVQDMSGTAVYTDDFFNPPPLGTRIVKTPGETGKYYIDWGDPSAPANTPSQRETNQALDFCFIWSAIGGAGTELVTIVQVVKIVTAKTLSLIPTFRLLIDKTVKPVNDDPEDPCFLGYTVADLVQYLEGGLQTINAYQPYPCWCSLDEFLSTASCYKQTLFEAALIVGMISQQIFAIDTDIPNYSDQGNSFVITHQQQLANVLNQISQRLDKLIPDMKRHFVDYGMIHIEAGPNYRLAQLVSAAPYGAVFRNIFFSG